VMLVALDGRPEWLAFAAGAYYAAEPSLGRYTLPDRVHDAVAYGVPVLVVAVGWLVRRELARRAGTVTASVAPVASVDLVPADAVPAEAVAADAERPMAAGPDAEPLPRRLAPANRGARV
jgi:hypothetical protein